MGSAIHTPDMRDGAAKVRHNSTQLERPILDENQFMAKSDSLCP